MVSACVTSIYSDHDRRHEVACDYQTRIHSHAAGRASVLGGLAC